MLMLCELIELIFWLICPPDVVLKNTSGSSKSHSNNGNNSVGDSKSDSGISSGSNNSSMNNSNPIYAKDPFDPFMIPNPVSLPLGIGVFSRYYLQ